MIPHKIPDIIKITARKLRKDMTESEKILWKELQNRKLEWKKFLRQSPVYVFTEDSWLDRYIIPDFVCKESRLVIELDWSVHELEDVYRLDREKEKLLVQNWYSILRFTNIEIMNNIANVLEKIRKK